MAGADGWWRPGLLGLVLAGLTWAVAGRGGQEVARAVPAASAGRVYLVLVDHLRPQDMLASGGGWAELRRQASLGLLNTATRNYLDRGAGFLTLGAGSRASQADGTERAYDLEERTEGSPVAKVYHRRLGRPPPPGAVVHPGIAAVERAHHGFRPSVRPVALGETLRRAGIPRAVIGNADLPGKPDRLAAAVLMDWDGVVDAGAVGPGLVAAVPDAPFGRWTDWDAVEDGLWGASGGGPADWERGVIAVHLGDLYRVDAYHPEATDAQVDTWWRAAVSEAGDLVSRLLRAVDLSRDVVIVLAPVPATSEAEAGNTLTPIAIAGRGFEPGQLLVSRSTRRPGLVTNTDVAPTVLAHFGLTPVLPMEGRPLGSGAAPASGAEAYLLRLVRRTTPVQQVRWTFVRLWVFAQLGLGGAALAAIALAMPHGRPLRWALPAVAAGPAAAWLAATWEPPDAALLLVRVLGLTAVLILAAAAGGRAWELAAARRWPGRPVPGEGVAAAFTLLTLTTAAVLAVDVALGARVLPYSLLGYSLVSGARYYGIGNEFAGVFLAGALVGVTAFVDLVAGPDGGGRPGRIATATLVPALGAVWLGCLVLVGWPGLGANFGAALAAAAGFSLAWLRLADRASGRRQAFGVAAAVAGVGLALAGVEALGLAGPASHLGQAVGLARESGPAALAGIAERKLALNWKLVRMTVWGWAFFGPLAALTVLLYVPRGLLRRVLSRFPRLAAGLAGAVAAGLVALVTNDSGVVAAAAALAAPAALVLALAVEERCGGPGAGGTKH